LNTSLAQTLQTLPSSATLISNVQESIFGNSPNSVLSQVLQFAEILAAESAIVTVVTTPITPASQEAPPPVTTQPLAPGRPLVNQGTVGSTPLPGLIELRSSVLSQANTQIRRAFGAFLESYYLSLSTNLLGPNAGRVVNPVANRAAFDAQVSANLDALDTRVTTVVRALQTTEGHVGYVHEMLVGADPHSLKSQLMALATPANADSASVQATHTAALQLIRNALGDVSGVVSALLPGMK
jgi:hypothetical protein